MEIVWLSANIFGLEMLKEAIKIRESNIKAIITLRENATTVMYDSVDVKKWYGFGIDVFEIGNINEEKNLIKRVSPELIVMCGWRQIIRRGIIDIPPKGVIGFHPTPLPKGRGPAPLINSIMQGFRESAITMFYISEGLDDGDIIGQEWFRIEETDHAAEVYEKCIVGGKKLISKYIPMIADGTAPRMPQDSSKATVFEKPSLKNNRIDLDKESIEEVYRKIRALSKPYRGAYIEKDGKRLVIWRAGLEG